MTYDDRQLSELNEELHYMTCKALDECQDKGVSKDAMDTLAYVSGVSKWRGEWPISNQG